MKHTIRTAAFIAGAMISLGAMAQSPDSDVQVSTETVKFNRAEAATPAGAADLYQSLSTAASHVCVDYYAPAALQRGSYSTCRNQALAKAVDDVKIEAVAVLHQSDRARKGTVTAG